MAKMHIVYWRDIPAQIIIKKGRTAAKVMLANRFQEAIDRAAMRAGKGGSEAYMEDWRRDAFPASDDNMEETAKQKALEIEGQWSDEYLEKVTKAGGLISNVKS
jgi:hypothetical protein